MGLNVLTLVCDEKGNPLSETREVDFRSNDNALDLTAALTSPPETCRNLQFVTLPVGFESSDRVPDIEVVAVCLSGRLKVSTSSDDGYLLEAGSVLRLMPSLSSQHTVANAGDEPVQLMIVQLK